MEYRPFGQTGMRLSAVGVGGLLARYEGCCGHPPATEKRGIYLRAAELGINLFDMGYGDEVHIPDELKGNSDARCFSLKVGGGPPERLPLVVDHHLANLRRDALDILRVHHGGFVQDAAWREAIDRLRGAGKVRAVCLIRHYLADMEAYAARGPEPAADADLVIYNYVCRGQEAGIQRAAAAGKGVLVMKALGGQWLDWEQQTRTDWSTAVPEDIVRLAPKGERLRPHLDLIGAIVSGPWQELCRPGESVPAPSRAVGWVLQNAAVSSVLVAFASVAELEETLRGHS